MRIISASKHRFEEIVMPQITRLEPEPVESWNGTTYYPRPSIKRYTHALCVATQYLDDIRQAFYSGEECKLMIGSQIFHGIVINMREEAPLKDLPRLSFSFRVTGHRMSRVPERFAAAGITDLDIYRYRNDAEYYHRVNKMASDYHYESRVNAKDFMVNYQGRPFLGPAMAKAAEGLAARMAERLTNLGPLMKKEQPVEDIYTKERIQKNKFYVGSDRSLRANWGHANLKDAIAHGEQVLESKDGETQFIVKIVKVIRRKKQPVVVEDVR